MEENKYNIIRKLSNKDLKLLKESKHTNFIIPAKLSKDGRVLPSVWKTWQILQKKCLGFIHGNDISGEFQLNEIGKDIAKNL